MRGNLYIVSAPSGSGKTTLLQHLLRSLKDLKFSVSYTTRRPRQGEQNGMDYFFIDRAAFLRMVEGGQFLEWAEFNGELYGTGRVFVHEQLDTGKDVILDIRSEEHTSELQSHHDLVCRLLLEKKKKHNK